MPTQSRGFFICDFCGLACDTLEEAKEHELHCSKRPGQAIVGPPGQAPDPAHQRYPPGAAMPPSQPYIAMPPQEMDYPPMMHPMALNPKERCIILLGPGERTPMSVEDSIACQNIELFEATPEEIAEFNRNGFNVVSKQVGIRCIHSGRIPQFAVQATQFPGSLGDIAKCVRTLADNHLSVNERVPPEVREACKRAASKRTQGQGEEGNEAKNDRDQIHLIGYCVDFCGRLRIVNKQPHKTGIEFANMGVEMGQYPYPMGTPVPPGRGPVPGPGAYPTDRYAPMMGMERVPFRAQGPPGSMPRGGPPPSAIMGGPPGPDGPAAHLHQTNRNRDGPYPGDRDGGPTQGGYPPQYTPGGAPAFGRPDGPPGVQNAPSQPNYEGQEQGPLTVQRQDGPPPGYPPEMAQYDLPPNFPFYQERDRSWHCKYCSQAPPQYRDPQSMWNAPNGSPPPGSFIDEHLNMCRIYHQTISAQQMYQGASYAPFGPQHSPMYGPPPGPWDAHYGQPGFPYPGMPDGRYQEEAYVDQRGGPPGSRQSLLGTSTPASGPPGRGGPQQALPRQENAADTIRLCINHLVAKERDYYARDPENAKIPRLVLDEDRLLLTDYFFYLMKQLRLCRFSESDRKTRGGKREKIKIGYGGLQCVHCADVPNSRKFFWSNVDRLANSFAEIPGHVLKCRRCPQQTKDALLTLKAFHPEQMARLPRGSQKVFFRRMWRRLHDEDAGNASIPATTSNEENVTPEKANMESPDSKGSGTKKETSSPGSPKNEDCLVPILPTKEAAEILAKSHKQEKDSSPLPKVLLAVAEDKNWLSDMDCFIRKQIEVFCATEEDVSTAQADRKYPVKLGQVGIRCIHCSTSAGGATGQAVSYPFSISGIYESVREFQRLHLDSCENVPSNTKVKLNAFKGSSSLSSVLRKYYVSAARALGLKDSPNGIRACGDSISITSQGAFNTPEPKSRVVPTEMHKLQMKMEDQTEKLASTTDEKATQSPSEKASTEGSTAADAKVENKESVEENASKTNVSPSKAPTASSKEEDKRSESKSPESNEDVPGKKESKSNGSEELPEEETESGDNEGVSKSSTPESNVNSGKKRASPTSDSEPPTKVAKTDATVEKEDAATDTAKKSPEQKTE